MSAIAPAKSCGHATHHGTCPACQRAAAERQRAQLAEAIAAATFRPRLPPDLMDGAQRT